MAVGNKKKKKPVPNPARTVATTSIQSKSRIEDAKDAERSETSDPAVSHDAPLRNVTNEAPYEQNAEPHEVSPEELEAQLEADDLQQFVEKHAKSVRRESARIATRLHTDKRVLRGQAEFLSTKEWLPDELVQQVLDFIAVDLVHEHQQEKRQRLLVQDDLVAKVWTLRTVLVELSIPKTRVDEVLAFLLQHPTAEESGAQIWGLSSALDWLAHHHKTGELLEYDAQHDRSSESQSNVQTEDDHAQASEPHSEGAPPKIDVSSSDGQGGPNEFETEVIDTSEVESDLEPDELLSIYLRTKAKLFEVDPTFDGALMKNSGRGSKLANGQSGLGSPIHDTRKLQQKLQKIQSDLLFDQQEADARWAKQKVDTVRNAAERRKLQLSTDDQHQPSVPSAPPQRRQIDSDDLAKDAERIGKEVLQEADGREDEELFGGMFDALPGVSVVKEEPTNGLPARTITTRDFGRVTGMTPRRLLDEVCRSRDSRCKVTFKQVSKTTYCCQHSVTIDWAKPQDVVETSYISFLSVTAKPRRVSIAMVEVATPDASQSESYIATAALFVIFSGSPKEEKVHLRLPPAFRDLWDELSQLRHEHADAADREMVKTLRDLVERGSKIDDDDDDDGADEVVFNASSRRLNGLSSGNISPASRPATPRPGMPEMPNMLKEIWLRKSNTPSYQHMLLQRANLPMFHAKNEALEIIERNQISIIVGDTGSGKSTQVPQFILEQELCNGRQCKIYCTEPRRISAISLAQRVSQELGESQGDVGTVRSLVGYAIRLESNTSSQTRLVYATVGIVLRMLENADGLSDITHLVLDEVHERSIDTDFLLIVLRSLVVKRPNLKIVLMSATVDAQKFSQYLDGAPIVSVPGRTFPVTVKYLEDAIELTGYVDEDTNGRTAEEEHDVDSDQQGSSKPSEQLVGYSKKTRTTLLNYDEYKIDNGLIVKLLERVAYHPEYRAFSSAILIFVPGIQEIRQLYDLLGGHPSFSRDWRVHGLHSTFSSEDQQAAFDIPPKGVRKIVIATNIAETGITIPDVTCVIDTGKHREMRFDERRQMSRLTQSFIARANAKQRRGRAGRVQEGICFHLFTKHRFDALMAEQQSPEMLRLSLQDLVMRVKICKLGDIETALSQALDPPSSKNVRRATDALIEVGALTTGENLTPLGTQLAKLPLDAQLGKLVLLGSVFGCLDSVLTIAAALSSKTPFLSPMHAKKQADSVRLGFRRGDSDLLTLYNAYSAWRRVCNTQGSSEYHFCNKNFLSQQNLANIEDLKAQLLASLSDARFVHLEAGEQAALAKVRPGSRQRNFVILPRRYCKADEHDTVVSSVIAWSFYPKIVKQEGKGWRNIANNQSLGLHPTSVNKTAISPDVKYLSFYSIMQSSSRFTNAQETSPVFDFALVLLAGEAVFHMYAGVIVIDGNRLRFKVRDWRTMIVLKTLRAKVKEAIARHFNNPGKGLGDRQRRYMELIEKIFTQKKALKA